MKSTVTFCVFSLLLACLLSVGTRAAEESALTTRSNGCPYYIMVNRAANTVTIYGLDEAGYYTVPRKAMVCSTAREGRVTPKGTYSLTGVKNEWCRMVDGTYGQYSSQFYGNFLFHSICYERPDPGSMLREEYNLLGSPASLGCVRLQVADAKWIFDNCTDGTLVTVYESADPGPLGKPAPAVSFISARDDTGWDPTDPREENPWNRRWATGFSLQEERLSMETGAKQALTFRAEPADHIEEIVWTSGNPLCATVDAGGTVYAQGPGTAVITGKCGGYTDRCVVTVAGTRLPFADVPAGAWYYSDVRYVYEQGLMDGVEEGRFFPLGSATWSDAVEALYEMSRTPDFWQNLGGSWYAEAFDWAEANGLLTGFGEAEPETGITRQECAVLLYRYEILRRSRDRWQVVTVSRRDDEAGEALNWAMEQGVMRASREEPVRVSRALLASYFRRYDGQ